MRALSRLQKLRFYPLAVTGGEGSYLFTEDNRKILDFSASWGAASLGHSHPRLREAINEALSNQAGASTLSAVNEPAVLLAEQLLENSTAGGKNHQVWLGHSGSDANETVARSVIAATGRSRIISFSGAYHGGTSGSMAISAHNVQQHTQRAKGLQVISYPNQYRASDEDPYCMDIIKNLQASFASDYPGHDVAALFIEPIQSDGGLLVPPRGFMKQLVELCRSHGILIVSDEVKVGMGRTGRFNCIEHEDVEPDILVLGKGLGGGLPLSAVIGPQLIMDYASSFSMQTLHGNPICASAGLAVLDIISSEKLQENSHDIGEYLMHRLRVLSQRHSIIGDVRGRGLAIGVELVKDRHSKEPATQEAAKIVYRAFELGLAIYYVGLNSNILEMTPPLNITKDEADEAIFILDKAIDDVTNGLVSNDTIAGYDGW